MRFTAVFSGKRAALHNKQRPNLKAICVYYVCHCRDDMNNNTQTLSVYVVVRLCAALGMRLEVMVLV
jgi:hypothetical protein